MLTLECEQLKTIVQKLKFEVQNYKNLLSAAAMEEKKRSEVKSQS